MCIPCVGKPLANILQMKSKISWNIIHLDNFRLPILSFIHEVKWASEWGRAKERIPQWVAYSWPCLLNATFSFFIFLFFPLFKMADRVLSSCLRPLPMFRPLKCQISFKTLNVLSKHKIIVEKKWEKDPAAVCFSHFTWLMTFPYTQRSII